MLREWSRSRSQMGLKRFRGKRRLSLDPFSYKYLVANIMTTTPDQSAIALPKKEPTWVLGLETLYRQIHSMRMLTEAMLSECSRMKLRPRRCLLANPNLLSLCCGQRDGSQRTESHHRALVISIRQTGPLRYRGPSQRTKARTSSVRITHSWSGGAFPRRVAKARRIGPSLGFSA